MLREKGIVHFLFQQERGGALKKGDRFEDIGAKENGVHPEAGH